MKAAINKKIRENSALSTMGIVIGIIICFIPFTSIYEKIPFGFVTTLLVIFSFVIGFSLIVMGIKAPFAR